MGRAGGGCGGRWAPHNIKTVSRLGGRPTPHGSRLQREASEALYPDRFGNNATDTPIMINVGNR